MKRWTLLPAALCLLFACDKEEVIPPSLRPDHEKQEQPAPTPSEPEPVPEPEPEKEDDLHDKAIPEDFRIPEVHITTENGKRIESKQDWVRASFRFDDPAGTIRRPTPE